MAPRPPRAQADISADPFREHGVPLRQLSLQLLGARFEFRSEHPELMRLVEWAYADLPAHRLSTPIPRMSVTLVLGTHEPARTAGEPAPFGMLSGSGFLCGASPATSMTVVSEAQRTALVVVARELLRFPYHVRYELIELAVFTLAARVQRLMPLHAACVGTGGRGLLLIGSSGAGKSTAVLHCALAGLDLVSEDSLFVTPDTLRATGIANFLHARRESLRFVSAREAARLRRSPVIRRRSGVEKLEIDLRDTGFRLAPRPVALVGAVELSARSAEGRPLLTPIGAGGLLERLRISQPYAAGLPGWKQFSQHVRSLPGFELRRGRHPDETVEALQRLLERDRHVRSR
jgi:hypothetical protein